MRRDVLILVVEDDEDTLMFLKDLLAAGLPGHRVALASSGSQARGLLRPEPDLVILDINLPDVDGFELCREVKQRTHAAVLVLTGRGAEADVVRGLEMGADDYLVKPFAQRELISRIRALLRRREMARDQESGRTIELGQLLIDLDEHRVWVRGREVHLTPTEFSLLRELASPPGRVHTHASLLRRVWGEAYRQEHHYVKSYVGRLRRKLGPAGLPRLIETAWGAGYRLVPPEEQP